MSWAIAGLSYCAAYVAIVTALGGHGSERLVAGNVGLLLPPLATLAAISARRDDWTGRQRVFWAAIAAWAALWFVGQVAWSIDEVFRSRPLPWFTWYLILQLSASALPLIALVAWPHKGVRSESAATAAIDVSVLTFLTGFLYWSLIIAPGMAPSPSALPLRMLATIGPLVRLAAVVGLVWAAVAARGTRWAAVYQRLAAGMGIAFVVLVGLSLAAVRGAYQTGSPGDIGWMLPFWLAASAAAIAPSSEREQPLPIAQTWPRAHPTLLFAAVTAVPIVGYGVRYLIPLGEPIDGYRDAATALTMVCGIALVMVRMRVEQRAVEHAAQLARLLATACEQTAELIVIIRLTALEYANDAFCRATGYSLEELKALTPQRLVAPGALPAIAPIVEALRRGEVARGNVTIARKDGSTFEAACVAAPLFDPDGRVTHFVGAVHDLTDDLRLRERLVLGERMSAIGELVSGVALELNNPLQVMIGTLNVMSVDDPSIGADLDRVRHEALRAATIIRNLLAFVRKSPQERVLCDLNEIVRTTVALRAHELKRARIDLREEYAAVLPLVLANRDEIQQIVLNLVLNAEQAMTGDGRSGELAVRTERAGADAVVEVADSGPGVPPEARGRIFEPFFTTKDTAGATGLGLSVAFGNAVSHGGALELVAAPRGARFRLTLPGAGFPGPAVVH